MHPMTRARGAAGRMIALLATLLSLPAPALAEHPVFIPLRDLNGDFLAPGATVPYSPEKTCGACHDTAVMTQGYHFQQGRTDAAGRLQTSDTFAGVLAYDGLLPQKGTGAWWKLSDGMYGKW